MREDLQCYMVGVSWSILDGACWSDGPDQLTPVSSTENAIFRPTNPDRDEPYLNIKDLSVKNADARSFKLVSCHLLFYVLKYNLFKN